MSTADIITGMLSESWKTWLGETDVCSKTHIVIQGSLQTTHVNELYLTIQGRQDHSGHEFW